MDENSFDNSSKKKNENYKVEDIKFPQLTKYEKELNLNFKYFNVLWYDPNKTNEFEYFKKCFENVQFYKVNDLESALKFFEKESSSEWIVIITDSKGEELINNLEENQFIKGFFVYYKTNTRIVSGILCPHPRQSKTSPRNIIISIHLMIGVTINGFYSVFY